MSEGLTALVKRGRLYLFNDKFADQIIFGFLDPPIDELVHVFRKVPGDGI